MLTAGDLSLQPESTVLSAVLSVLNCKALLAIIKILFFFFDKVMIFLVLQVYLGTGI